MKRYREPLRALLLASFLLVAFAGAFPPAPPKMAPADGNPVKREPVVQVSVADKQRGVAWVAGRRIEGSSLDPLLTNHVGWIAQTPFGWQESISSPRIRLATEGVLWGETDEGLRQTTRMARQRGLKTLLKPHIWVRGQWRGEILMASEADWRTWFDDYGSFLLHYAKLAEAEGIEALCIGTELHQTVKEKPEEWRRLIQSVRAVYRGQLTYAANWYQEFEDVPFWGDLDAIGVQAYFPLRGVPGGTLEELRAGWQAPLASLESVSRQFGKPILVTEVGYRSTPVASSKPWEWPRRGAAMPVDLEIQRDCYEAFFREVWPQPWLAGVFWWKWYPVSGGSQADDFSPQGRPAEQVLRQYFSAGAGATLGR